MIHRSLADKIEVRVGKGKAIILIGARQIGKSTMLRSMFQNRNDVAWISGDEPDVVELFDGATSTRLKQYFGSNKILIIDEAQYIPNVGRKLKLFTDFVPDIQIIATGSSAFELMNSVNEPLTGRKWEYQMFPLSFKEMVDHHGLLEEQRSMMHRLIYGYYPEVVTSVGQEREVLKQLTDSYLYKDLLMLDQIKKSDKIVKLLQALAYQVGSQVSYNELSRLVGIDNKTVEKYIDALEKAFVIYRLSSYTRNLRNELKNTRKIYFYDNGVRNALIADFRIPEMRTDVGQLWENFLISERMKKIHRDGTWMNRFMWRTKDQNEIDYLEEYDGKLYAFEFKWSDKVKVKIPKQFSNAYPETEVQIISKENYVDFLLY
jgi:uncharacterized protein